MKMTDHVRDERLRRHHADEYAAGLRGASVSHRTSRYPLPPADEEDHRPATDIRGVLPITTWLPAYDRANLRFDVIAGVTVAALVVPKALGYAGIAQVPLQNGLYAAAAGALIYALFGTSRQISTGPARRWPPSPPAPW